MKVYRFTHPLIPPYGWEATLTELRTFLDDRNIQHIQDGEPNPSPSYGDLRINECNGVVTAYYEGNTVELGRSLPLALNTTNEV